MVWKVVNISDAGTSVKFGADDTDKINKLLSGIDVDDVNFNVDFEVQKGIVFKEQAAPSSPASTKHAIYVDSTDFKLRRKNSSGVIQTIEPSGRVDATYYIYKDGSNYKSVNAQTGAETTNSSFATIINGAIDTVTALTEGGKILLVGDETFALPTSGVINLKSEVTLEGLGHSTKITKADSGDAISIVGGSGTEVVNWAIKNIRLVGPSTSGTPVAGDGIYADFADKGLIENCDISGFGSAGDDGAIHIRRCQEVTTTKCRLHDSKNGFITSQATGVTAPETELCQITQCYAYSNYNDGIHAQNSARISITNNHVFSNSESGIDLLGDNADTVTGNVVYGNTDNGIETGNTTASNEPDRYHTITGNTVRDNGENGFHIGQRTEYCVISSNTSKNNTFSGIQLSGTSSDACQWNIVTSNICEANTLRGIYLVNGPVNDNYIVNNIVRNNASRGIYLVNSGGGNPSNNIIAHNTANDNTTSQITDGVTGTTNKLYDNFLVVNSSWVRSPIDTSVLSNPYIGAGTGATLRRTGLFTASGSTQSEGFLASGVTAIGTNTAIQSSTEGSIQQYATTAVANANAGLRWAAARFRREYGCYVILRVIPSSTSDIRCFIGWSSDSAEIAGETTLDNFSGAGVGKAAADTNWFTYRNDGDATQEKVDTGITFAASVVTIELELDSTSFRSRIGGTTNTAQTTELPASTTNLALHVEIETGAGAADKTIQIAPIWSKMGPEVIIQ